MNSILQWHSQSTHIHFAWRLVYRGLGVHTLAVLDERPFGEWLVTLRNTPRGIRCRNLHEAADCARRWAEYRGFSVASRFPEGRSHE